MDKYQNKQHILPTITFCEATMNAITMQETIAAIISGIESNDFIQHAVINVAKLVHMQSDLSLKKAVNACDIINIDGMGLVWGLRLLGCQVPERVAGIDLFVALLSVAEQKQYPVYFLGAKQDVLDAMIARLRKEYPKLMIAGYHHGYFWDYEQNIVTEIRNSGAYLLFVAISSPKKEIFIDKWKDDLGVRFVMGVGGSFDVLAGKVKRAPLLMQKIGLEWFYRFLQEPRRMWKRYLITNTKFAWLLIKEMKNKKIRHRDIENTEKSI